MQTQDDNNYLPIPLYHGTSTLFLNSIINNGLGGVDPISEWKIIELSKEVYQQSELHLKGNSLFIKSACSFKSMTEQSNLGCLNWQHGKPYLSSYEITAAKYPIGNKFGSEILTYTFEFLKELINLKIKYVMKDLYEKYRFLFDLLETNPKPVLIKATNIPISALLTENGGDPKSYINEISDLLKYKSENKKNNLPQFNFQLISAIPITKLNYWGIRVVNYSDIWPKYNLYEI
ncbi:MAG: hypothetical protein Q7U54_15610 [Bacteroidales bacterium]|nr:hypothetical protein [Bacteroidales bacterium]